MKVIMHLGSIKDNSKCNVSRVMIKEIKMNNLLN